MGKYTISEPFSWKKLWEGLLGFLNPTLWAKDLVSIFNVRKLIIYTVIIAGVFVWGYNQGNLHLPVKIDLGYGKEVYMVLNNNEQLHITKKGEVFLEETKTGKIIKQILVKDVPNLKNLLKPYGFILRPIAVFGASSGKNGDFNGEVGLGISFFKFYRFTLDTFITTFPAIYAGGSYDITENFGVGLAVGQSLKDISDQRIIIYGRFRF